MASKLRKTAAKAKRQPSGQSPEAVASNPRKTVFVPFAGTPNWRSTSTSDFRLINAYIDRVGDALTGNEKLYVVKRPGLAAHNRPPNADATGRGIYFWRGTDKVYTVFGDKIYSNTTDLGVTLDASSGRCWFAETPSGFGGSRRLLVSDGTKLYSINTSDVVSTISSSSDAQFPTPNQGPVVFFDSYIFLCKSNGQIWNSDVDTITDWTSTSFVSTEMYGDLLFAIARQRDQIIAFGEMGMEFYFDNANDSGSPLLRIDQNAIQIGLAGKNTLAQSGELICFVGSHYQEEPTVWMIDGLSQVKKISTPAIERLLRGEGSSVGSNRGFLVRSQGHVFYFLNLAGANRTIVYDVSMDCWTEATDTSGNKFNIYDATAKDGTIYMQDATNGRVYTYSPSTYQDNSSNFTVTIQLAKINHGTSYIKHSHGINIIGDITTGNLTAAFSDDDYANFNTSRNVNLAVMRKFLPRLGAYFERSWKFTYADNYALRLQGFDEFFDVGTI